MATRASSAVWNGDLAHGNGTVKFGSGAFEGRYTFKSRFEEGEGTNPEELIAAAHAGCFSMALAGILREAGYEPRSVQTTAKVSIEPVAGGFAITRSELSCRADVPGIDRETFLTHANNAKSGCPVSKALAGVAVSLAADLV